MNQVLLRQMEALIEKYKISESSMDAINLHRPSDI